MLQLLLLEQKPTQRCTSARAEHIHGEPATQASGGDCTSQHAFAFPPPPKQRGSQLFNATPFHTGAASPLWRGEELPDNGSRAAEPKWLLEISFPQMKHASSSAVKKNHARALWMGPSARLGNKTLPLRSVMHACTPGSRGEEVITWNISEIPCGQSAVVSVEATSSSYAAMLANLSR